MWEMLVKRDFVSFLAADWSPMEPDFWAEGFLRHRRPRQCRPRPVDDRLSDRGELSRRVAPPGRAIPALRVRQAWTSSSSCIAASRLDRIEIVGNRAVAHKKFDGAATTVDGQEVVLRFQSIFHLARGSRACWKIAGFVGYLPNPMC